MSNGEPSLLGVLRLLLSLASSLTSRKFCSNCFRFPCIKKKPVLLYIGRLLSWILNLPLLRPAVSIHYWRPFWLLLGNGSGSSVENKMPLTFFLYMSEYRVMVFPWGAFSIGGLRRVKNGNWFCHCSHGLRVSGSLELDDDNWLLLHEYTNIHWRLPLYFSQDNFFWIFFNQIKRSLFVGYMTLGPFSPSLFNHYYSF